MLPVAVDALGGDKAPAEIIDGAKQAAALGIPVLLVGPADLGTRFDIGNLPLHVATEFIDMPKIQRLRYVLKKIQHLCSLPSWCAMEKQAQ